jgi:protein involved in polysaccharide export with SLBB domain
MSYHQVRLIILSACFWASLGTAAAQYWNPSDITRSPSSMGLNTSRLPNSGNIPSVPSIPRLDDVRIPSDDNALFETINDSTYVLGPGDLLLISYGTRLATIPVNPEGLVVLEEGKPIQVGGSSMAAARTAIMDRISKSYKNERSFVTLARAKHFQVSITGAVVNPGVYTMPPGSRIYDLVLHAGGFSNTATRKLQINRKHADSRVCEPLEYFSGQNLEQNPYLMQGDATVAEDLDYSAPFLWIKEDKNVSPFQLKEQENLRDLLMRYDSFRNIRQWDSIYVFEGTKLLEIVPRSKANEYRPVAGRMLEIHSYKPTIYVSGAVIKPGPYDYNVNLTAYDYLALAGITQMTGRPARITVTNALGQPKSTKSATGTLEPGDHVVIGQSSDAIFRDYLAVITSIASLAVAIATFITLSK